MAAHGTGSKQVLVIEDDPRTLELVERTLERESLVVECCGDAETGMDKLRELQPGLVLLGVVLPGIDGLQLCKRIKCDAALADVQVIMLTRKGRESDVAVCLAAGADDYLVKPFDAGTLVGRVRAVQRRGPFREARPAERIVRDGIAIDPARRELQVDERPTSLTATELRLLHFLASHPGRVFTREQLMSRAIRDNAAVIDRNIDVHIGALRRKLGPHRGMIETVRGIGYRFRERALRPG